MNNEELAKKWNVSASEVQSISEFMNKTYYLCIGKKKETGLYHGLMYRRDKKHGDMLAISTAKGYKTPKEAGDYINNACDTIEMPDIKAALMGVPVDAYKTIKKIDTSIYKTKESNYISTVRPSAARD